MTRQWDTQAGREAIEKLRRDNAIMKTALADIAVADDMGETLDLALTALARCHEPPGAESVLGGEPAVSRETMPTPPLQLRQTDFQIGVEQLDAIKAGVEPETSGKTEPLR